MTIQNKLTHHRPPFWGLMGLALIAIFHGYAYGPWFRDIQLPLGLNLLTSWYVPMWVFAAGWFISGAAILWSAVRGQPGWAALGGIVMMTMTWGTFYLIGWADGAIAHVVPPTRAYISAVFYLGLGLYIWGNVPSDDQTEAEKFTVKSITVELQQEGVLAPVDPPPPVQATVDDQ